MIIYHFIFPTNLENTMKVLFFFVSFSYIIKSFQRFIKLFKYSRKILGLLACSIFLFTAYFRVRFDGIEVHGDENKMNFSISFTSFYRTTSTLWGIVVGEYFPALPKYLQVNCLYSYCIFWIFVLFNNIILIALVTGTFYFIYMRLIEHNYLRICGSFKDFENKI